MKSYIKQKAVVIIAGKFTGKHPSWSPILVKS